MSRQQGVLERWDDARGFGFVVPAGGGPRLFAHVSEFPNGRRPVDGCQVTFVASVDHRQRACATSVRYAGRGPTQSSSGGTGPALLIGLAFFVALGLLVLLRDQSVLLPAAYAGLSLISLGLYGADKSAAVHGRWRTSESTLHAVDVVGGWPGGLVARHLFRHKTRKQPFRTVFWLTVVVNVAALGWLVWSGTLEG